MELIAKQKTQYIRKHIQHKPYHAINCTFTSSTLCKTQLLITTLPTYSYHPYPHPHALPSKPPCCYIRQYKPGLLTSRGKDKIVFPLHKRSHSITDMERIICEQKTRCKTPTSTKAKISIAYIPKLKLKVPTMPPLYLMSRRNPTKAKIIERYATQRSYRDSSMNPNSYRESESSQLIVSLT